MTAVATRLSALADLVRAHPRLFVLTGAGVSTASGIPGYRDVEGNWQHRQPVSHQDFVGQEATRKRYWARSMLGWKMMGHARPNAAHRALARLEEAGHVAQLVTQNVDRLHQQAGSRKVIELHGSVHEVVCLDCGAIQARAAVQARLEAANPQFLAQTGAIRPDGDADIERGDFDAFALPDCPLCGGTLKPDVVFFGASVPRARGDAAAAALDEADAVLVVGSSLMVYSGYKYCERAHAAGKPLAAINLGRTRADHLLDLKVEDDCASVLTELADQVAP